jgi:hypothetical protein
MMSDRLFDLASFLTASARGSLEEGVFCASLRLIEALTRLIDISNQDPADEFLKEINVFIKKRMTKDYLASEERYVKFLDEVLGRFADEIRRRNGLGN